MTETASAPHRYKVRTLFVSDTHLGSQNCKAGFLLELLERVDADSLYLVGDIIDGHRLRHERYWPQSHEDVLNALQKKARQGSKVTYIPGNHDEGLRELLGVHGIALDQPGGGLMHQDFIVKPMDVHTDARGGKHLVIHTDQFDSSATRWFYGVGDVLYDFMAWSNRHLNHARERMGLPYWSLAGVAKQAVKRVIGAFNRVERQMVQTAHQHGVQGIIGGHTHDPVDEVIGGIEVRNDGDMVDSITAMVEDHTGRMQVLHWAPLVNDYKARLKAGEPNPQAAFAPLAQKFGAVPQEGPSHAFRTQQARSGNVASQHIDLIEVATFGTERMGLSLRQAVRLPQAAPGV